MMTKLSMMMQWLQLQLAMLLDVFPHVLTYTLWLIA